MAAGDKRSAGIGAPGTAIVAETGSTADPARRSLQSRDKPVQWIPLPPARALFSPAGPLAWVLGLLGVAGWMWRRTAQGNGDPQSTPQD